MMTAIAVPAYAQQTPDAAKAPAAAQDTAPASTPPAATPATPATPATTAAAAKKAADTPDVPSADTLKKARGAGYHTKIHHGEVYYCKDVVETGTRFKTESCLDENQLAQVLERQQIQRDQLTGHSCGGSGCSGK
jgi:hypothetical protein